MLTFSNDLTFIFRSVQKLEELEKEEELRDAAGLYDSEPVSDMEWFEIKRRSSEYSPVRDCAQTSDFLLHLQSFASKVFSTSKLVKVWTAFSECFGDMDDSDSQTFADLKALILSPDTMCMYKATGVHVQ